MKAVSPQMVARLMSVTGVLTNRIGMLHVYKLFDRNRKEITCYGCMAHVRRKFVDALNTAYRLLQVVYKSFKGIIAIQ